MAVPEKLLYIVVQSGPELLAVLYCSSEVVVNGDL